MIARAATVRPWILWQIAEDLKLDVASPIPGRTRAPRSPEEEGAEYFYAFSRYIDLVEKYFGKDPRDLDYKLQKLRFFAATGSRWFQFGHSFWKLTMKSKTLEQMRSLVSEYASRGSHPMCSRV